MDLDTLCTQFYDYSLIMRGFSPATIRRYKTTITTLRRLGRIDHLEECTNKRLRDYFYRGRAERKWSVGTFATYHDTLAVFFQWCVEHGHLPANPIEGIEIPKRPKPLPRGLSRQDAQLLLEVVQNYPYRMEFERYRNHALLATILFAGLRRKEVLGLHVVDVNLEGRSIFVREGKGDKERVVPMGPGLIKALSTYADARRRANKTCPQFFTSLTRNTGLSFDGLRTIVRDMQRATGIKFSAHRLRHTFATLMLEGGTDIFSISKMLGHSDIKTTTIYLAASPEHLREQMTKHPLNWQH